MSAHRSIFLSIVTLAAMSVQAQWIPIHHPALSQDTIPEVQPVKEGPNRPRTATLWSTFLPGAGQIYNGKYWKAGIVYAGAGGLIYMFSSNTDSMNAYQDAYIARVDTFASTVDTRYPYLTDASVKSFRDYHRRMRDIAILGFVGLYALQIIDANVDAHLHEFRVNEDLSLRVEPEIRPLSTGSYTGLRLRLRF